ncbi:MAG: RHS repeat-associated core domain-containing protein, partial [Roseiarcus sp.]
SRHRDQISQPNAQTRASQFSTRCVNDSTTAPSRLSKPPCNKATYDANGNRLSETTSGVASSYAYPATSNRLSSVTPAGGATRNLTYDAAGNILTDTRGTAFGMTFQYDVEGRLSTAYQTGAPANGGVYGYDAFGRLASRTVTQSVSPPSVTTLYIHDINDHIIAETDTTGATLREYIWLNDLPVAVVDQVNTASPQVYYVHTDHLGRPARMVAQNWAWVWDVIYSPFGDTSYLWNATGTSAEDMRFPGQWFQLETGLAYNWHRHYDASLGRYAQPDPIGLAGGRNVYGYVGGNPLSWVDPWGLGPWGSAIGGWIGGVVAGALGSETGPGDVAISILGRRVGAEFGSAIEDFIREKTAEANEKYPRKACGFENHHIIPKYLGGPADGPTTNIPKSYHQLITNEIRSQYPYPYRGNPLGQQELEDLLTGVYDKYPILPGK